MWSQVCVLLAVGGGGAHHNIQLPPGRDASVVGARRVCQKSLTDTAFTFTQALHTPRRVPHRGGLKERPAHGELEAHGGCGERYGSRVRENDGR